MTNIFEGKIVVIAGNGQELAIALARAYLEAGSRAVIVATPSGERIIEASSVEFQEMALADPAQSTAFIDGLIERYGHIDIWINTFAIAATGPAETLSPSFWEENVTNILSAAFYNTQAAGRQMLKQGHGVIVNLTSVIGLKAVEGHVANTVLHAGLQGMTNALGVEWAGRGVRVVGVALPLEMGEASRRTPLRAAVTAAQIADTLLYLTSDEAAYVTAETIRVDGGWSAYQLF
jgi:NAD(P)-dependent dehydrogenase (short-subunit alcohol dehydrogenase family)